MTDTQAGGVMGKPTGLRQRGNSWEMRVRVPGRLRTLLPTERVISFGPVSFKDACRLGVAARADIERQFEEAEMRLGLASKPLLLPVAKKFTEAELVAVARRYLAEREVGTATMPFDEGAQDNIRGNAIDDAYCLGRSDALDDAGMHALAERFAERQGYRLPGGAERYPFLEAIQAALMEHCDRIIARLDGATVATINPAFAGVEPLDDGKDGVTLAEAVEMYIEAPERSSNASSSRKMDRS